MSRKRKRSQPPFEPRPLETYRILREHSLSTITLVSWHFKSILKSVNRKISLKQSFRNPFTVTLSETIHSTIFYHAFRAIRDFPQNVDVSTKTEKDKKGNCKTHEIVFKSIEALILHLTKLTSITEEEEEKQNIEKVYFRKNFTHGQKGKIVATTDKPAIFHYKVSTCTLTVTMKYEITNQFGTVCSY